MKLIRTLIPDVVVIVPEIFQDERGWFMESFNEKLFHAELENAGLPVPRQFVQDNHSCSKKGVVRGLHFQNSPHAQGKLVRVVTGAVYDVAVDIRPDSPTFGNWVGVELSAANKHMLWIPEGFAHGFLALEDSTELIYKVTDYYSKQHEGAIRWDDNIIKIAWPASCEEFCLSEKDAAADDFAAYMAKVVDAN